MGWKTPKTGDGGVQCRCGESGSPKSWPVGTRAFRASVEPLRTDVHTLDAWRGAFYAGMRAAVVRRTGLRKGQADRRFAARPRGQARMHGHITREEAMQRWKNNEIIHRRELPEPPERHEDLASHPLGELFLKGEEDHLRSHIDVGTWEKV